jgi:hypothetical protein
LSDLNTRGGLDSGHSGQGTTKEQKYKGKETPRRRIAVTSSLTEISLSTDQLGNRIGGEGKGGH